MTIGGISAHVSLGYGLAWIRRGDRIIRLLAPWNRPQFSERNGYEKPIAKLGGWRVFYRNETP
jgi:hypothetical protein